MLTNDLERFCQLALQDPSLLTQLNTAENSEQFNALAAPLSAQHDCHFTTADIQAALLASRQAWMLREAIRQPSPLTPTSLTGWVPIGIYQLPGAPQLSVDWGYFGTKRFTEPFFEQTIQERMTQPHATLFRATTPIETLCEWQRTQPGLPVAGFIFHLSRCGSTLITQMLSALPHNVVLSEAPSFDQIIRAPGLSEDERIRYLRALVSAYGQPRTGGETHVWFKLDSWHVLQLPLFLRAFPDVPWIFLYREPIEILVSHARMRGSQMIPGILPAEWFGLRLAASDYADHDHYTARTMERICAAALQYRAAGKGRLVNYSELPHALYDLLPHWFNVSLTEADTMALRQASSQNAKEPRTRFANDTTKKQQQATVRLRELAETWVNPHYCQLEAARLAQPTLSDETDERCVNGSALEELC